MESNEMDEEAEKGYQFFHFEAEKCWNKKFIKACSTGVPSPQIEPSN